MYRAASKRSGPTASGGEASRTLRASRRSSRECEMRMTDLPYTLPDERGHFGPYGGVFVAETLMRALDELKAAYARELKHYVGRPSPVYHAERWSRELGGAQIWLKREDLNHTGAHKINNVIGQALLAKRLGKRRII